MSRGIDVRSIYCPQSMERPGRFATVRRLSELGEQSRMLPQLPFKLHIIDKQVALVPLSGPVYDDLVVIHPSGMLDALMELYEAYWARAEPITGTAPADDDALGPEDVLILGMLKAGLKDLAIGRQLGCSTRTATRRVTAVLLQARGRHPIPGRDQGCRPGPDMTKALDAAGPAGGRDGR
ncbi:hypothetical protein SAMN06272735_8781 [Streptomyces sp. TLI_55]|uniref:hypothetical protein n=1 Tax=Streptomyces sp. TLI_55 TaxID=1938861 RepID=UPI000BDC4997|nr:hypothetical protein [Streptomyces sp. TLI_55]SNX88340.1 hypothetical protein SAMN06272735_8781 [Streptomyces sp. TLI_55]